MIKKVRIKFVDNILSTGPIHYNLFDQSGLWGSLIIHICFVVFFVLLSDYTVEKVIPETSLLQASFLLIDPVQKVEDKVVEPPVAKAEPTDSSVPKKSAPPPPKKVQKPAVEPKKNQPAPKRLPKESIPKKKESVKNQKQEKKKKEQKAIDKKEDDQAIIDQILLESLANDLDEEFHESESQESLSNTEQEVAENQQIIAVFKHYIRERIEANWSIPPYSHKAPTVVIEFQLSLSGLISKVHIVKSSGSSHYDQSALAAIRKTGQLVRISEIPSNLYYKEFQTITMIFNPE